MQRLELIDSEEATDWYSEKHQGLCAIRDHLELKTNWHPIEAEASLGNNFATISPNMGFTLLMTKFRTPLLVLGFIAMGLLGFWLAKTAAPGPSAENLPREEIAPQRKSPAAEDEMPRFRKATREPVYKSDQEAADAGALLGQRVLVFKDNDALEAFLKRAGNKVLLLGRLDALNALRIGFLNMDLLAGLLDGQEEISLIFPVDVPTNSEGIAQDGAIPLGAKLLEWLGITGDNSSWGAGIKIAILDTGVLQHSGTTGKISWINLLGDSAPPTTNGHGTAVASMINGNNPLAPGIAPSSQIVSVRIADNEGGSNSFLLAAGIVAAVDAGASIINISMGSFGDSAVVRNAIEYAREAGSVIIAAAGNNGTNRVTYPGANQGVTTIGSVDGANDLMAFSNRGTQIAFAAPGYNVNAAWPGDQYVSVSGTSFSTPIFSGTVAGVMTAMGVTATQAIQLIGKYSNDVGSAGNDLGSGAGVPNIGRILNSKTRGIYDAAVASQQLIPPGASTPNGQIEVLVQNRGTENLVNARVDISTPSGIVTRNITSLMPQGVHSFSIPINVAPRQDGSALRYDSQVTLTQGKQDSNPTNDRRSNLYTPAP